MIMYLWICVRFLAESALFVLFPTLKARTIKEDKNAACVAEVLKFNHSICFELCSLATMNRKDVVCSFKCRLCFFLRACVW